MPYALSIIFLIGISVIFYLPSQSDFHIIFPIYTIVFAIYFFFIKGKNSKLSLRFLIGLAVIARITSIFAFPNLSDDIYRFIWDGELSSHLVNPYSYLPSELIAMKQLGWTLDQNLYDLLNSQSYYSIYPPVSQFIFYLSQLLSDGSWLVSSIFLKLFMTAAECGSIYLLLKILDHYKWDRKLSLLYALNPLVIIETCGNLHFEGFMVFFFLLFVYSYIKGKKIQAFLWFGLSVATKLLPLIFVPLLVKKMGWKPFVKYGVVLGLFLALLFSPLFLGVQFMNFFDSIDLYFRSFEFNASIYYLLRFLGFQISGYNLIAWIGPILGIISLISILIISFKHQIENFKSLFGPFLIVFSLYLFLGTTIHPWYLIMPICISVFITNRYILVWSYLIFLSYINYSYPGYHENLWIVTFEYLLVFGALYLDKKKWNSLEGTTPGKSKEYLVDLE
jgi:hypothetical protein